MKRTLNRRFVRFNGCWWWSGSLGLIALLLYGLIQEGRPPRIDDQQQLFQGIHYQRQIRQTPRPLVVHIVTIDLQHPGIRFLVTPGEWEGDRPSFPAQTTSAFLQKAGVQIAVNGSFFRPAYTRHPFDYYPKPRDPVEVMGLSLSEGQMYSSPHPDRDVLCVGAGPRVDIESYTCPDSTVQAIAGYKMIVNDGQALPLEGVRSRDDHYPRTTVAIDALGRTLWWVVVDGRQPFYSEGVTLPEMSEIVLELGADRALDLDGGGSTTLVVDDQGRPKVLNSPIHTGIPGRERPVANHLGIYAHP